MTKPEDIPQRTADEWQPIETLRHQDTVLLAAFHDGSCYWVASGACEDGTWFCDFTDAEFQPQSFQKPTHWMPLPPHPAIINRGENQNA